MPLKTSKSKNEKDINKVVSQNIEELEHHGTRPRSQKQIVAIAESAARGRSGKNRSTSGGRSSGSSSKSKTKK